MAPRVEHILPSVAFDSLLEKYSGKGALNGDGPARSSLVMLEPNGLGASTLRGNCRSQFSQSPGRLPQHVDATRLVGQRADVPTSFGEYGQGEEFIFPCQGAQAVVKLMLAQGTGEGMLSLREVASSLNDVNGSSERVLDHLGIQLPA